MEKELAFEGQRVSNAVAGSSPLTGEGVGRNERGKRRGDIRIPDVRTVPGQTAAMLAVFIMRAV